MLNRNLIIVPLLLAFTSAAAEPPARELLKPSNDIPGLSNFAKISDALYRGAQPDAAGFAKLKEMGIKTIVNLRSFHSDRDKLEGSGLQYVHLNCKAWHAEEEDVVAFLKVVQDPKNQPVFVHCQHGADRTGMMVAAYRIVVQGWSNDDAAKETHNFGFHEMFEGIQKALKALQPEDIKKKVESAKAKKVEVMK
ncbi:MAG TPA: dual specificity protein phosphatase family protein [Planctomycetota bacterium]